MKRIFTIVLFIVAIINFSYADKVDKETAHKVATIHYANTQALMGGASINLAHTYNITINTVFNPEMRETTPLLYVFNVGNNNGIILVSGDDVACPVLGYTNSGSFDADNLPNNFRKWIEGYKKQISYAIENNIEQQVSVREQWKGLISGVLDYQSEATMAVGPLCTTKWNQLPYYNDYCPGGSVTGCVATAMAQVMKYWNHPAQGSGMHSYNHQNYGTLSANFGNTAYQWSSMPDVVSSSNDAVATLMYHCGVSVDMNYSPDESGAWVIEEDLPVCSESAFKNYFGYSSSLHGEKRDNYSTSQWTQMLRADLDAGRPLVYAGFGGGGGHAFVCDGYDAGDYFHFNWGWGGQHDGYFHIDALNPSGTGTGGGSGGYNSGHQAIFGMIPETTTTTHDIRLYANLVASPNPISFGQAFSVTTSIANYGSSTMVGDFAAYVFDENMNVIDDVETLAGTIVGNEWVTATFETTGMTTLLPGNYTISLYFRPTDENWIKIGDGDYSNTISFSVINENDIRLYSDINISCGTTITVGESFNVNVDIANYGTSYFYGTVDVSLYDLEGYFIETVEMIGGVTFENGYYYGKVFTTSGVSVEPGSYLMAVQHKADGGNWQLSGSSEYPNPIQVIVKSQGETADLYEPNDYKNSAESLGVNFSGNTASINTAGSNSHNGADHDFYRIDLPAGNDYVISSRVHDSYNSGNGQTYTNDVLWSFNTGYGWSSAYDDVINGNIMNYNGGTVWFHVAPYFLGTTGTYLLDIQIQRNPLGVDDMEDLQMVNIYPNPVTDLLNIELSDNIDIEKIQVMDISGKTIISVEKPLLNGNETSLYVGNFDAGTYIVIINSNKEVYQQKFIKTN